MIKKTDDKSSDNRNANDRNQALYNGLKDLRDEKQRFQLRMTKSEGQVIHDKHKDDNAKLLTTKVPRQKRLRN